MNIQLQTCHIALQHPRFFTNQDVQVSACLSRYIWVCLWLLEFYCLGPYFKSVATRHPQEMQREHMSATDRAEDTRQIQRGITTVILRTMTTSGRMCCTQTEATIIMRNIARMVLKKWTGLLAQALRIQTSTISWPPRGQARVSVGRTAVQHSSIAPLCRMWRIWSLWLPDGPKQYIKEGKAVWLQSACFIQWHMNLPQAVRTAHFSLQYFMALQWNLPVVRCGTQS